MIAVFLQMCLFDLQWIHCVIRAKFGWQKHHVVQFDSRQSGWLIQLVIIHMKFCTIHLCTTPFYSSVILILDKTLPRLLLCVFWAGSRGRHFKHCYYNDTFSVLCSIGGGIHFLMLSSVFTVISSDSSWSNSSSNTCWSSKSSARQHSVLKMNISTLIWTSNAVI